MNPKAIFDLLKETVINWLDDKAPMLAAALAYYTIFSLAPLIVLSMSVAGLAFGEEEARRRLLAQINIFISPQTANTVESIIENADRATANVWATTVSVVIGLVAASIVFRQLKITLNTVWGIALEPGQGIRVLARRQLLAFGMVLIIGFLLLLSVAISAVLGALNQFVLRAVMPGLGQLLPTLDFVLSLVLVTFLFALLFKILPDVEVAWRDVWLGAAVTALLFSLGKYLIALYVRNFPIGTSYGAASSLVIVLLWVYFSAQILLFGAEFTQAYANRYGSKILPARHAMRIVRRRYEEVQSDAQPEPAPATGLAGPPTADTQTRQREKQVAALLLGLAVGLLLSFWGGPRGE
jgi:membrane protein